MKNILILSLVALFLLACSGADKEKHFITDSTYRAEVHKQFLVRKEMAKHREKELFGIMESGITTEQREALEFLYAYMPLNDLADYDGEFFLKQVDYALATREAFAWGKSIPEEVFRHFVLPHRINNENLDTARVVFFNELKDRLKGMSMYDAALEVNHWCHEYVVYQSTDNRTSAPLALVRTSYGRCGEESTFTTAALRAAGIPARQCYTPRWAHTDDNHAWVEVWIDGKWCFLGACEPEPELNVAWFTAPAKRAMLVHTNVFGSYHGKEEAVLKNPIYSKINLLDIYAPIKELKVKVVDANNNPVADALVNFKLFNYSEFYNIATKNTDTNGATSLTTGLGDLFIWANKNGVYGYSKINVSDQDEVIVVLNRKPGEVYTEDMDMVPPIPRKVDEVPTDKQVINDTRLKQEDSIRAIYVATFATRDQATQLAKELNLPEARVVDAIKRSVGNWRDVSSYITKNKEQQHVLDLFDVLLDKDVRDTPTDVLTDHVVNAKNINNYPADVFKEGVLSPRMRLEILSAWRGFLQSKFDADFVAKANEDINTVINWVRENITINTEDNYYLCPITPIGVYNLRVSDAASRDFFFIALCRSMGIASRLDMATNIPQYYAKSEWHNVVFETKADAPVKSATLVLNNLASNTLKPEYYTNLTLARYDNGDFVTLDYENNNVVKQFPIKLQLELGYYRLITGNRTADGSVLTRATYFNIADKSNQTMNVDVRPIVRTFEPIGKVGLNNELSSLDGATKYNLQKMAEGKGLILAFLDPTREPTRHVMNDIPLLQGELEGWGGGMLFAVADDKLRDSFNPDSYAKLPKQLTFAVDKDRAVMTALMGEIKTDFTGDFPVIMLITPKGEVVFLAQGYRIGIGEDLIKSILANNLN